MTRRYREGIEGINQQIDELLPRRAQLASELDDVDKMLTLLYTRRAGKALPGRYCNRCGKVEVYGAEPGKPEQNRIYCDPCRAIENAAFEAGVVQP